MMKRLKIFCLLWMTFCLPELKAQTVGLVLSGGGAKGAAHLGVIKALEENNIPIDYVAGTSIGASMSTTLRSLTIHRISCTSPSISPIPCRSVPISFRKVSSIPSK